MTGLFSELYHRRNPPLPPVLPPPLSPPPSVPSFLCRCPFSFTHSSSSAATQSSRGFATLAGPSTTAAAAAALGSSCSNARPIRSWAKNDVDRVQLSSSAWGSTCYYGPSIYARTHPPTRRPRGSN